MSATGQRIASPGGAARRVAADSHLQPVGSVGTGPLTIAITPEKPIAASSSKYSPAVVNSHDRSRTPPVRGTPSSLQSDVHVLSQWASPAALSQRPNVVGSLEGGDSVSSRYVKSERHQHLQQVDEITGVPQRELTSFESLLIKSKQQQQLEIEYLKQQLKAKDGNEAAMELRHRAELRELMDVVRIGQEELAAMRKQAEALKQDAVQAREREQRAVHELLRMEAVLQSAEKDRRETAESLTSLEEDNKRLSSDVRRLEELCAARAKEIAMISMGRSRCEKKAAALHDQTTELAIELRKLREADHKELDSARAEVARLTESLLQLTQDAKSKDAARISLEQESTLKSVRLADATNQIAKLQSQVAEWKSTAEDHAATVASLQSTIAQTELSLKSQQAESDSQEQRVAVLAEELGEVGSARKALLERCLLLEKTVDEHKNEIERLQRQLDAALDECDGCVEALQDARTSHATSIAELQKDLIVLRRTHEDDQLKIAEKDDRLSELLNKISAIELERNATAERCVQLEHSTNQVSRDYFRSQQAHDGLISVFRQDIEEEETVDRSRLEEAAMLVIGVLALTAVEVPHQFDALLRDRNTQISVLRDQLSRTLDSLEVATSSLEQATKQAPSRGRTTSSMSQSRSDAVRETVVHGISELLLRSRLARRRLRSLFSMKSWRLLVQEHLVPDDFGQMLCEVVDDFQWIHEHHRLLSESYFTDEEKIRLLGEAPVVTNRADDALQNSPPSTAAAYTAKWLASTSADSPSPRPFLHDAE